MPAGVNLFAVDGNLSGLLAASVRLCSGSRPCCLLQVYLHTAVHCVAARALTHCSALCGPRPGTHRRETHRRGARGAWPTHIGQTPTCGARPLRTCKRPLSVGIPLHACHGDSRLFELQNKQLAGWITVSAGMVNAASPPQHASCVKTTSHWAVACCNRSQARPSPLRLFCYTHFGGIKAPNQTVTRSTLVVGVSCDRERASLPAPGRVGGAPRSHCQPAEKMAAATMPTIAHQTMGVSSKRSLLDGTTICTHAACLSAHSPAHSWSTCQLHMSAHSYGAASTRLRIEVTHTN